MKKTVYLFVFALLSFTMASCSKSAPDQPDLTAQVEGTYQGQLITGTSNYVTTQVKLTKIDNITVKMEHLNGNPAFAQDNISLSESGTSDIQGDSQSWLIKWSKISPDKQSLAVKNKLDNTVFSGEKQ